MKRPNGTGSVIRLSGKRRRPYAVRLFDGVEIKPNGNAKKKYKYLGYFEKQSEALQYLEKYNESPVKLAKAIDETKKHRFSEIYDMYIDELSNRSKTLSRQSFDSRNAAYKKLAPLHDMIFEMITLDDLESVTNKLSHMSLSSITNIKIVLKGMYKTGMRHKYVSEDLSALMIMDHLDECQRPHTTFTKEEIKILWQHKDEFYPRLFLILIYTGMRVNELLSLKSENVFMDDRYMIGGSKTRAGKNRMIPIAEKIVPLINTNNEYIIMKDGKPLLYDKARRDSIEALESLGMHHSFHDTRHTCTTLLEKAKVPSLHIKLIVGHTTNDITEKYTHVDIQDLIDDINKI